MISAKDQNSVGSAGRKKAFKKNLIVSGGKKPQNLPLCLYSPKSSHSEIKQNSGTQVCLPVPPHEALHLEGLHALLPPTSNSFFIFSNFSITFDTQYSILKLLIIFNKGPHVFLQITLPVLVTYMQGLRQGRRDPQGALWDQSSGR